MTNARLKRASVVGLAAILLSAAYAAPLNAHPGHQPTPPANPSASLMPGTKLEEEFPAWRRSTDFAIHTKGDSQGYHLSIARERERFVSRPLATIQPGGYSEDDWLGYHCVTGNLEYVMAVVLPRGEIN